jgi:hypothetical protein
MRVEFVANERPSMFATLLTPAHKGRSGDYSKKRLRRGFIQSKRQSTRWKLSATGEEEWGGGVRGGGCRRKRRDGEWE